MGKVNEYVVRGVNAPSLPAERCPSMSEMSGSENIPHCPHMVMRLIESSHDPLSSGYAYDSVPPGQAVMERDTTSMTAPSMTGLGYNPSIPEGLGALLVDALQQPQVSMANNEAGPSTHLYAGSNPSSGLEMWSMTDTEFQSLLNASAHGSVAPLDRSAFLDPSAFSDDSSPFLPFP